MKKYTIIGLNFYIGSAINVGRLSLVCQNNKTDDEGEKECTFAKDVLIEGIVNDTVGGLIKSIIASNKLSEEDFDFGQFK